MTCANCKALREELADTRRQLGLEVRRGDALKLITGLGVSYGQANILLRMYYAKRPLRSEEFLNSETVVSVNLLRSQVCHMRKKLGANFSNAARGRNSDGYWLTPEIRARVAEALDHSSP